MFSQYLILILLVRLITSSESRNFFVYLGLKLILVEIINQANRLFILLSLWLVSESRQSTQKKPSRGKGFLLVSALGLSSTTLSVARSSARARAKALTGRQCLPLA